MSRRLLGRLLQATRVAYFPVRVRGGVAAGAAWTLYPWTSYWRGTFEPDVQAAIAGVGDFTGKSCWDVGAHFGLYSVGLARRVGPTGQVAAFEPNPFSYGRLARHRRMNRLDWLLTFPAAVSDVAGRSQLLTYGQMDSTTTHLQYEDEVLGERADPIEVATVRLDELHRAGEIRAPWLVKIDAEGHGHRALQGMSGVLAEHHPILVVAFHSGPEVEGVRQLLAPHRYKCRVIDGEAASPSDLVMKTCLFTR